MPGDESPTLTWRDLLDKSLEVGLGAVVLTKQSVSKLIDELVAKGSLGREEARKVVAQMVERGREEKEQVENLITQTAEKVVERAGLARRADLEALAARVDRLERQAESGQGTPG
jgi:polyhydroxyalkanoate synthesis regulator phasin